MTLIDRLRTVVSSGPEEADGELLREAAPSGPRGVPPMDLEIPERLETATFALG